MMHINTSSGKNALKLVRTKGKKEKKLAVGNYFFPM